MNETEDAVHIEGSETFGSYLQRTRHAAKVTQRELGAAVGIDYTYISKMENDQLPAPAEATISRIAAHLRVSPETMLALSRHVPKSLKEQLRSGPVELSQLLHALGERGVQPGVYRRMLNLLQHEQSAQ